MRGFVNCTYKQPLPPNMEDGSSLPIAVSSFLVATLALVMASKRSRQHQRTAARDKPMTALRRPTMHDMKLYQSQRKHQQHRRRSINTIRSVNNPRPQIEVSDSSKLGTNGDRIVIVMVGLPGRGKTFIGRKIAHYVSFFHGATVRVFNNGQYRRKYFETRQEEESQQHANFFAPDNEKGNALRELFAKMAMDDLKEFLAKDVSDGRNLGKVAIIDATNTTSARRQWVVDELEGLVESKYNIIFIESVLNDATIVEANVRSKLRSPDYKGKSEEEALVDFRQRIAKYEAIYEPVGDDTGDKSRSYIRLIDAGKQVVVNRIRGYLAGRIVQFCMNLHTIEKAIYLSPHGQSEYNRLEKIGGDAPLTPHGMEYARKLAEYVEEEILSSHPQARLWTSSLLRTIQTGSFIRHNVLDDGWVEMRPKSWRALDELHAGVFDGQTFEEIKRESPEEFKMRARDKLHYRYPRGESYLDVVKRLEPVIHELERLTKPVLIVAHQGIIRILCGYLLGLPREECIYLEVPLNTIKRVRPHAYGCDQQHVELLNPAKDFKLSAMSFSPTATEFDVSPRAGMGDSRKRSSSLTGEQMSSMRLQWIVERNFGGAPLKSRSHDEYEDQGWVGRFDSSKFTDLKRGRSRAASAADMESLGPPLARSESHGLDLDKVVLDAKSPE